MPSNHLHTCQCKLETELQSVPGGHATEAGGGKAMRGERGVFHEWTSKTLKRGYDVRFSGEKIFRGKPLKSIIVRRVCLLWGLSIVKSVSSEANEVDQMWSL
jgi:hypothetical protein